jgi:transcription antitermination factor NusG
LIKKGDKVRIKGPTVTGRHQDFIGRIGVVNYVNSTDNTAVVEAGGYGKWWSLDNLEKVEEFEEFKVGDKVILGEHTSCCEQDNLNWSLDMNDYIGKVATITGFASSSLDRTPTAYVDIDNGEFIWRIRDMRKAKEKTKETLKEGDRVRIKVSQVGSRIGKIGTVKATRSNAGRVASAFHAVDNEQFYPCYEVFVFIEEENWSFWTSVESIEKIEEEEGLNQEEVNRMLMEGVGSNNTHQIGSALASGADINYQDGRPLATAVARRNMEVVKLLVEKGAIANERVMATAEGYAEDSPEIFQYLDERKETKEEEEEWQFKVGDRVRILNRNLREDLGFYAVVKDTDKGTELDLRIESEYGGRWVSSKDVEKIKQEEEWQFKVGDRVRILNGDLREVLGNYAVVKNIDRGSRLDLRVESEICSQWISSSLVERFGNEVEPCSCREEEEMTEEELNENLVSACYNGHQSMVRNLLCQGADINYLDGGPLEEAIRGNKDDIVIYLLRNGADINIAEGRLLSEAIIRRDFDWVEFLVDNGAVIDERMITTAEGYAEDLDDDEILRYLEENSTITISTGGTVEQEGERTMKDEMLQVWQEQSDAAKDAADMAVCQQASEEIVRVFRSKLGSSYPAILETEIGQNVAPAVLASLVHASLNLLGDRVPYHEQVEQKALQALRASLKDVVKSGLETIEPLVRDIATSLADKEEA